MPDETPGPRKPLKKRGLHASHANDPTLGSYLSSLLHLLSFPVIVLLAFVGHLSGFYEYSTIIPVTIGAFVLEILVVVLVMYVVS